MKVLPSPKRQANDADNDVFFPNQTTTKSDSYRSHQETGLLNSRFNYSGNSRSPAPLVRNFEDELEFIEDDIDNSRQTREYQRRQFFESTIQSADGFEQQRYEQHHQRQQQVSQTRTILPSPVVSVAVILNWILI